MRCPKCARMMLKVTDSPYLLNGAYFYRCDHCNHVSELMTDNNIPFWTEEKSVNKNNNISSKEKLLSKFKDDLDTWKYVKKSKTEAKLIIAHKKRVNKLYEQYEKYGLLTDDDINNIKIDLWEFGKKKTKKKGIKK